MTYTTDLEFRRQEVARLRREGMAIKDIAEQLGVSTTTIRHDLDRVPPRPGGGPDDEHEPDYRVVVVTPAVAARIAPVLIRALRAALADRQRVAEDVIETIHAIDRLGRSHRLSRRRHLNRPPNHWPALARRRTPAG